MDIQKELEALALHVESKRITKEVSDYRDTVMERTSFNKVACFLLAGEFMANAATIVSVFDGDEEAAKLLREFADNIENRIINKDKNTKSVEV